MNSRLFVAALAAAAAACGGGPPDRHQTVKHFGSLSEDLPCAHYHVDDGTEDGHSSHLGCTGLYASWADRTLSEGVRAFAPGYLLWSDGADKDRWILLPPDSQIDSGGDGWAGTMDGWIFPVGTKTWKQFAFGSRLIETRLLWKRGDGWFATTYVWSEDQSSAIEHTTGALVEGADPDGPPYQIPSAATCATCHIGAVDALLGFEAISLAAPQASGLTLDELARQGLLTRDPEETYAVPGDPDAEASLGWLHANCGVCHSERIQPGPTLLHLRLLTSELSSVESTEAWRSAVGQPSLYWPPVYCGRDWNRIRPGDPDCSTIAYRMSVRDPYPGPLYNQMPPLLSHRVPGDAVEVVRRWIASLSPL